MSLNVHIFSLGIAKELILVTLGRVYGFGVRVASISPTASDCPSERAADAARTSGRPGAIGRLAHQQRYGHWRELGSHRRRCSSVWKLRRGRG